MQYKSILVLSAGAMNSALEAAFAAGWAFNSMVAMGGTAGTVLVIVQKSL